MENKMITKIVKKYGNSGGVYVPSSWIGGKVNVRLVLEAPNPRKDLLLAFADKMQNIISILIYGSYARGEATVDSDIDVIIVTEDKKIKVPEFLKKQNYDITVMSEKRINHAVKNDAIFYKMLEESRAILNEKFIKNWKKPIINQKLIRTRIDFAESALNISEKMLDMNKEIEKKHNVKPENTGVVYSLIMRIKEMTLINCLLHDKKYSTELVKKTIKGKNISMSDYRKIMAIYKAVRDNKQEPSYTLDESVIRSLIELLGELIEHAQKKQKIEKRN